MPWVVSPIQPSVAYGLISTAPPPVISDHTRGCERGAAGIGLVFRTIFWSDNALR